VEEDTLAVTIWSLGVWLSAEADGGFIQEVEGYRRQERDVFISSAPLFFSLNSRSERRNGIERVGWEVGRNGKFVICDLYMIREGREKKK